MNQVVIRQATASDAELIADLSRETFYNAFAPYNTKANMDKFMNEVFTREKLIAEVAAPGNIFLLAFVGDEPAGYVRMRDKNLPEEPLGTDNIIEIARIYTASSEISKGIGSLMLKECVSTAKEMRRQYIWLGVWEKNDKAIRFYERHGFKTFGDHTFMLGDDVQTDLLMARQVEL
ncbi:MAG TPA: GNAT family N-acetyltransferase [Parafilimonas sp.]|nr:GNAT family N-acetyltransferase [Parafilimonas sp.]